MGKIISIHGKIGINPNFLSACTLIRKKSLHSTLKGPQNYIMQEIGRPQENKNLFKNASQARNRIVSLLEKTFPDSEKILLSGAENEENFILTPTQAHTEQSLSMAAFLETISKTPQKSLCIVFPETPNHTSLFIGVLLASGLAPPEFCIYQTTTENLFTNLPIQYLEPFTPNPLVIAPAGEALIIGGIGITPKTAINPLFHLEPLFQIATILAWNLRKFRFAE